MKLPEDVIDEIIDFSTLWHTNKGNSVKKRFKKHFKPIFHQAVLLIIDQEVIDLKDIFVDSTKIEANANRYTFVWDKSIKKNETRIEKQLKELCSYVE